MSKVAHAPEVTLTDVGDYFELVAYEHTIGLPIFHKDAVGNEQALANAEFARDAYNHHQELVTRLYNITNQVGYAFKRRYIRRSHKD